MLKCPNQKKKTRSDGGKIKTVLTYSLENIGSDKLYEYLYKRIKKDIEDKHLAADDKLPSKREFAKNLGVSIITVETAYSQLMAEGYIYSVDRKGFFVAKIEDKMPQNKERKKKCNITHKNKREYFADFVTNTVSVDDFPFSTWMKLLKEMTMDTDKSSLLLASSVSGVKELREAIASHLYNFRGMEVEPEQIIIGAGTEYLYSVIVKLLGRDMTFGIENPGYKRISQIYKSNGVKVEHIDMDAEGVVPHKIEKSGVDVLHISPSHHYPTGIVMPIGRRYELLGWAAKDEKRYIIEDDYDCEFRLYGKPVPVLQSVDRMDKVIYVNTFSKSLAPTFRISYMVLPVPLVKEYYDKLGFYSCTVSAFEQYTLARFITEGYFERHINRMRNHYRNQRDIIVSAIKKNGLSDWVEIKNADEGLHMVLEIKKNISDELLKTKALANNINIACLSEYYQNHTCDRHAIILSYSGVQADRISQALDILFACIKESVLE